MTEALAPDEIKKTVEYANEGPVTLMLDESNKRNNDKGCAILLRNKTIDRLIDGNIVQYILMLKFCLKKRSYCASPRR